MTNFITSIELQQASEHDYRQLIQAMKKASFTADHNNTTAGSLTFRRKAKTDIREIIDTVVRVVSATGRKFSFTVTKEVTTSPATSGQYLS